MQHLILIIQWVMFVLVLSLTMLLQPLFLVEYVCELVQKNTSSYKAANLKSVKFL